MAADRPNFLFIITDQQRADHLGCYGNSILKTPNIDRLADRGLAFDRFYVASPTCMPNRATMLTGRMPSAHGVLTNGKPLPLDSTTFLHLLQAAGYRTPLMGKAHFQNFTDGPVQPQTFPPRGEGVPPPAFSEAVQHPLDGREYANERMTEWAAHNDYAVETPYYGFDEVKLAILHGDRVQGDYSSWLAAQHPDPNSLRGPRQCAGKFRHGGAAGLPDADARGTLPDALDHRHYPRLPRTMRRQSRSAVFHPMRLHRSPSSLHAAGKILGYVRSGGYSGARLARRRP